MTWLDETLDGLRSPLEADRLSAVTALVEQPERAAASALAALLSDPSARVREVASAALQSLGAASLQVVLPYLGDRDPGVRALALEVAKASGSNGLPQLMALLESEDKDLRRFGIDAIADIPGATADQAILARLDDSETNVQVAAIEAIGHRGMRQAASRLVDMLSETAPFLVNLALIQALAQLGEKEALPTILSLTERAPLLAGEAIAAWGALGEVESLPALLDLALCSGNEEVRSLLAAAWRLHERKGPFDPAIVAILRPHVLAHCVHHEGALALLLAYFPEALKERLPMLLAGDPSALLEGYLAQRPDLLADYPGAIPALLPFLTRWCDELRLAGPLPLSILEAMATLVGQDASRYGLEAARILEQGAGPGSARLLSPLVSHGDPDVVACGLRGLARLTDPEAAEMAMAVFHRPEADLWEIACQVLGASGDPRWIPELQALHSVHRGTERGLLLLGALVGLGVDVWSDIDAYLGDADGAIRCKATQLALQRLVPPSALVFSLLNDPDPRVRRLAIRRMARMEGPEVVGWLSFILRNDEVRELRRQAIAILIEGHAGSARELLAAELSSDEPGRREDTIEMLLAYGDGAGSALLEQLCQTAQEPVIAEVRRIRAQQVTLDGRGEGIVHDGR